jgi:hypothetical protein
MGSVDIHSNNFSVGTGSEFAFLWIPEIRLRQHLRHHVEGRWVEYFLLLASAQRDVLGMLREFRSPSSYLGLRCRAHEQCQGNLVAS